jgi:K+-sensing histidine kinase KdpD
MPQLDRLLRPWIGACLAVAAPVAVTAILLQLQAGQSRDYAFVYLAAVALLALGWGLIPALIAAAVSFLAVDYFFVPPVHTLTIADETDLVNLLVFFGTAGVVGGLASRRRHTQLAAEALSRHLRETNVELERLYREQEQAARTAVRLAEVQRQVSGLQETDRLRRELLQNVSHELRTPLGTILAGTTSVLSRDDISEGVRQELELVVSQSRRLDRLVADLLDLARIEGHALELRLEPVDMRDAATSAAERLRRVHPSRTVNVSVDGDTPDVLADWDRLAQVWDNLLGNADRFAPASTPIDVTVVHGARDVVVARVADHGPGVPANLQQRVFERFVGEGPEGGEGTGLGLAIVKGLVEAHAGRVWLDDSAPGEGAAFAFSLPAAPVAELAIG